MFGFDPKKDNLVEDKKFKGSFNKQMGLSKWICPTCGAHLKESRGDLICLNTCHLPSHMQKRFSDLMRTI